MNIEVCREFLELARSLNFTEAANTLHITQPALSKHIAALEAELNTKLFVRDRHDCRLSETGRIFFGAASQIVSAYDYAIEKMAELMRESPIRVDGVIYDPTISSIISLTTILLAETPHQPLLLDHHEDTSMLSLIKNKEIDLLIGYEFEKDLERYDLVATPFLTTRFCAIVDAENPLAELPELHAKDLEDQMLLKFIDPYAMHGWRSIEAYLLRHGIEVRSRSVMGRIESYQSTPLEGAVSIQPSNLRNLKFLSSIGSYIIIPFADEDALFHIDCIYRRADTERLRFLVDMLLESRDIVSKHRAS